MRPTAKTPVLTMLALAASVAMASVAAAQSPPTDKPPVAPKVDATDSRACGPGGTHATVGQGGDIVVQKPDDQSLSSKLADSGGVICPPRNVDPEIATPTPPAGRMPVIPPPGSPGGNPQIQPK